MSETSELSRSLSSLSLSSNATSTDGNLQKSVDYSSDTVSETGSQSTEASRENTQSSINKGRDSKTSNTEHVLQHNTTSSSNAASIGKDGHHLSDNLDNTFSVENDFSRSNTINSDKTSLYSNTNPTVSRESTVSVGQESYQDDFDLEWTSKQEDEIDLNSSQNEIDDEQNISLEKETSILIERDGKFELVSPSDLEVDEVGNYKKRKPKMKEKPVQSKLIEKAPGYENVTSSYALTEAQMEMKKRRISVRNMRLNEEKQRRKEEEEKQRVENEKSYKKWLVQKSTNLEQPIKKQTKNESKEDEEKRKIAEKSFNDWLKQKEISKKQERKMERIRLADEAEHYIVRDRATCEKSFQQWLKQKKIEENKHKGSFNRKSEQKKLNNRVNIKPASAIYRTKKEKEYSEHRSKTFTKTSKPQISNLSQRMATIERMSKVRYCETFGYQHPASYSDILI